LEVAFDGRRATALENIMASDNVINFETATFDTEVLQSETPVLVDFWAPWCAPCRMIAPSVEDLADSYAGRAKVGKVNVDDNQAVAQRYNVMSIPTLLVFKGGKVVDQVVGAVNKAHIESMLEKAVD
jgi:thioredoxin 1